MLHQPLSLMLKHQPSLLLPLSLLLLHLSLNQKMKKPRKSDENKKWMRV